MAQLYAKYISRVAAGEYKEGRLYNYLAKKKKNKWQYGNEQAIENFLLDNNSLSLFLRILIRC